jgi:NAD(P)-dependent dehydrogenase (short-subunit alcohol dehydrogenase family)
MSLEGKKIAIIGGSSGIGLAAAQAAIERGAKVVIAGRSEDKLARAKQKLGAGAETRRLDASIEEEVRAFFGEVGELDHLVVTAGTGAMGPFLELDPAEARSVFEGKFWSQYLAALHGAPRIRDGGTITLFAGVASVKVMPGLSALAAVNGALEALGRTLAVELGPRRVNVVSPGLVDTPAHDAIPEEGRRAMFESVAASVPARRVARAEDIARTVAYLWESPIVTGEVLYPDGGHRLI